MRPLDEGYPYEDGGVLPQRGLSPAGRARREIMLGELVQTMQQIRRRRRRRRATASAAIVLGLVAVGLWVTERLLGPTLRPGPVARDTSDPPAGPIRIRVIGDEELLTLLAEVGRPAGLVRSEGHTWLTSDVTDAALERREHLPERPVAPPTL